MASAPNEGKRWSFEEFCEVYCNPNKSNQSLAKQLGRSEGAIDAVRASIDAVHKGTATCSFPGCKWIDFVNRADNGQCGC